VVQETYCGTGLQVRPKSPSDHERPKGDDRVESVRLPTEDIGRAPPAGRIRANCGCKASQDVTKIVGYILSRMTRFPLVLFSLRPIIFW
jgi:hypothetical protein